MVLAIAWGKENKLIEEKVKWYEEKWENGHILEAQSKKIIWDFQFKLRKTNKARRPDLILEDQKGKVI